MKAPGHGRDLLTHAAAVNDKEGLDQIFDSEVSLSDQPAEGVILAQAPWAKHRIVHGSSSKAQELWGNRLPMRTVFILPPPPRPVNCSQCRPRNRAPHSGGEGTPPVSRSKST